jgi:hypothetical protein
LALGSHDEPFRGVREAGGDFPTGRGRQLLKKGTRKPTNLRQRRNGDLRTRGSIGEAVDGILLATQVRPLAIDGGAEAALLTNEERRPSVRKRGKSLESKGENALSDRHPRPPAVAWHVRTQHCTASAGSTGLALVPFPGPCRRRERPAAFFSRPVRRLAIGSNAPAPTERRRSARSATLTAMVKGV